MASLQMGGNFSQIFLKFIAENSKKGCNFSLIFMTKKALVSTTSADFFLLNEVCTEKCFYKLQKKS